MHNNQSYTITRIQTQKHVANPCTAFIAEEDYYHNSLVYRGGPTLYKVRLTNYRNTILVVSFMQIGLSNNIYSYTQCHTGIFESRMHLALFCSILFSHYPYLNTRDNFLRTMDTILMYQKTDKEYPLIAMIPHVRKLSLHECIHINFDMNLTILYPRSYERI